MSGACPVRGVRAAGALVRPFSRPRGKGRRSGGEGRLCAVAAMNDAEVNRQIQQMVKFIKQEADEKASEIAVSAEEVRAPRRPAPEGAGGRSGREKQQPYVSAPPQLGRGRRLGRGGVAQSGRQCPQHRRRA